MPNPPFSQRHGHRPVRKSIQHEAVDESLRTRIWNVLLQHLMSPSGQQQPYTAGLPPAIHWWAEFFNLPLDSLPVLTSHCLQSLHLQYQRSSWFEVYDLIEFSLADRTASQRQALESALNDVLKRESSVYRIINGMVVPISDDCELNAIDLALGDRPGPVRTHLASALSLLSDREFPDYRNSMKESISAVEAMCKQISKKPSTTLKAALDAVSPRIRVNHNLQHGFKNLYDYTSGADGIRHALTEEPTVDSEDALFMLVSCSAFVNYLTVKATKAGIDVTEAL